MQYKKSSTSANDNKEHCMQNISKDSAG